MGDNKYHSYFYEDGVIRMYSDSGANQTLLNNYHNGILPYTILEQFNVLEFVDDMNYDLFISPSKDEMRRKLMLVRRDFLINNL